jgi:hypothetical protein
LHNCYSCRNKHYSGQNKGYSKGIRDIPGGIRDIPPGITLFRIAYSIPNGPYSGNNKMGISDIPSE